jgi:hypothetical protein
LAKASTNLARQAEAADFEDASDVLATAKTAAVVFRWQDLKPDPGILNVNVLGGQVAG